MSAAFRCRLGDYSYSTALEKLGSLISASAESGFATHFNKQIDAWKKELRIIGEAAAELVADVPQSRDWWILLEYEIPRRQKRPDVILLAQGLVFVIEFKVDSEKFLRADEWQVQSYALDLRDFHAASRGRIIVPILVATAAPSAAEPGATGLISDECCMPVQKTHAAGLAQCVRLVFEALGASAGNAIDPDVWENSAYRPTPTIIEAAEGLFADKQVADISHSFATNLDQTCGAIIAAVQSSQSQKCRTICFVTGTPGAGKTLAGLNAVHNPALRKDGRPAAMFLSGNGPLVKIVREALARDRHRAGTPRPQATRLVSTLIANVHEFLTHHGIKQPSAPPPENTIVFDEAQRAWNAEAVEKQHGLDQSEPGLILEIMERATDWCTVVALVGEGQEINRGEAGLAEWGRSLNSRRVPWRVMASRELMANGNLASGRLFANPPSPHIKIETIEALHLAVSVRSPRARRIGQWVDDLLCNRLTDGAGAGKPSAEFPMVLTRDLASARQWLRERAEVHQRAGLLASSGALRLRAEGIEVSSGFRKGYPYEDWFLSGSDDTRSSGQLEVAATEFECQGLELDWVGVCWGGDFVIDPESGRWASRKFRGKHWQKVKGADERRYLVNKYRVLLTRARRGMVLWVPHGDAKDVTQDPRLFDATAGYLECAGIPVLEEAGSAGGIRWANREIGVPMQAAVARRL